MSERIGDTAIAPERTPLGRRAVYLGAGLVALLAIALLFDDRVTETLTHWPLRDRVFFGWLTRAGESDWMLIPPLILWLIAWPLSFLPFGYTNHWAFKGMAGLSGYAFVGVALPGLASNLIKRLTGRARPVHLQDAGVLSFHPVAFDWSWQSFPSGHATTAIALSVVLAAIFGRKGLWFVPIAILICLSRIVVGLHFLSDVLGGVVLGYFGAALITDFYVRRGWGFRIGTRGLRNRFAAPFKRWWRRLSNSYSAAVR